MPTKKTNEEKVVAIQKTKEVNPIAPQEMDVRFENKSQNPYLIPLSVVVAGFLIAIAILYKGQMPVTDNGGSENKPPADVVAAIGLRTPQFESCLKTKPFANKIQTESADAEKAGAEGTPFSVVIAANGKRISLAGAYPYEVVKQAIDEALAIDPEAHLSDKEKGNPIYEMSVVTSSDHIRGNPNAPVKIVEFSDLQCPYCQVFHGVMQQVMADYGSKGQVAWVYRHLPLTSIHQYALTWAEEAECAAQVGGSEKFWEYVDARFASQAGS
ncbi:MAG: thioredoxin domain-containing protein [Patescibacteria group bacterium]